MNIATIAKKELKLDESTRHKIPSAGAIYAIFEKPFEKPDQLKCRFVGNTPNLSETMAIHCSLQEPNVGLRYFMISLKEKSLRYLLTEEMDEREIQAETEQWVSRLKPDCCG